MFVLLRRCLLDVTVSCELNEGSRDSYLCDALFHFHALLTWRRAFVADYESFLSDFRTSRAKETQRRLQNVSNS